MRIAVAPRQYIARYRVDILVHSYGYVGRTKVSSRHDQHIRLVRCVEFVGGGKPDCPTVAANALMGPKRTNAVEDMLDAVSEIGCVPMTSREGSRFDRLSDEVAPAGFRVLLQRQTPDRISN
jgi:hypothetical protein